MAGAGADAVVWKVEMKLASTLKLRASKLSAWRMSVRDWMPAAKGLAGISRASGRKLLPGAVNRS